MKKKITSSALCIFVMTMGAFFVNNVFAQTPPSLGTAASFSVLAGSTVTNTGPTVVGGNVGVSPGTSVTGFPPGVIVGGSIHANNAVSQQAQSDLTNAYNNLSVQSCNVDLTGQNLGGLTLTPGTYCFSTSTQLTGTLVLDAQGNPNAVFLFKVGSTLSTASGSSVVLINGGNACNVFFQVGSSATLGTGSNFLGNILALTSITVTTGASVNGRVLARNGAVTIDTNNIGGCTALQPTAAMANIGGRVLTPNGAGATKSRVSLTITSGETFTTMTNSFGYYKFTGIESGQTVVISVTSKRYRYSPKVLNVGEDLSESDFVPE
ncbi:MAG TPA: ice-binding family protein [Pyrinomonadaceae bacterium]|jgi:hypothetical protein